MRSIHIVFHSGYDSFHSHQECMRGSFLSTSSSTLPFIFFIITLLTDVRWYFIMVLICISLMISNIQHILYIYWPPICLSRKCIYSYSYLFLTELFVFMIKSCKSFFLYILDISSFDMWLSSTFSHWVAYLFILLMASYTVKSFLVYCSPICLFLLLLPFLEEIGLKKYCWDKMSKRILPKFSCRHLMFLNFTFVFNTFWVYVCMWYKKLIQFHFFWI